jgi:hypothetical protein
MTLILEAPHRRPYYVCEPEKLPEMAAADREDIGSKTL